MVYPDQYDCNLPESINTQGKSDIIYVKQIGLMDMPICLHDSYILHNNRKCA